MRHSTAQRCRRLYQHITVEGRVADISAAKLTKAELLDGEVVHVYKYEGSYDLRRVPAGRVAKLKK